MVTWLEPEMIQSDAKTLIFRCWRVYVFSITRSVFLRACISQND